MKSLAVAFLAALFLAALVTPAPRSSHPATSTAVGTPPAREASGPASGTPVATSGASDAGVAQRQSTQAPYGAGEVAGSNPAPGSGVPLPTPGYRGTVPSDPRLSHGPGEAAISKPSASGTGRSTPQPRKRVLAAIPRVQSKYGVPWLTRTGKASHMGAGYPATYLALPHGPGWRATICGAGGCVTMTSNDAGPDLQMQREGRVADLSVATFEKVCGVPSSMGLCAVSVTILGKAR